MVSCPGTYLEVSEELVSDVLHASEVFNDHSRADDAVREIPSLLSVVVVKDYNVAKL